MAAERGGRLRNELPSESVALQPGRNAEMHNPTELRGRVHLTSALLEGTHKRTYRIRSKVHSELSLHIIVPTAYISTIFK